ncbi:MAG: PilZ domain-containing protein [Pirellulales bacterium]
MTSSPSTLTEPTPSSVAGRSIPLPAIDEDVLRRCGGGTGLWNDARRFMRKETGFECLLRRATDAADREFDTQQVWLRDLSRGGIRLLHGAELAAGEHWRLTLPNATDYRVAVVWCRRVDDGLFVSGCRFVADDATS